MLLGTGAIVSSIDGFSTNKRGVGGAGRGKILS